jgi:zinc transport system substrate-binding protein
VAIAVVIPLAMVATMYTGAGPEQIGDNETNSQERIVVVASFYPLYEFASHVGGNKASVSSLVPAGIEPHDWEPTPRHISLARSADLAVINGAGFETWTDRIDTKMLVNTSAGIELEHEAETEQSDIEDEHGHEGAVNPHIWLDPVLAKHQVQKIRDAMGATDPENADYYSQNAAEFTAELDQLDAFARLELGECAKSDFIAFHDAFAHFAERYGLTQHSIHGVSPEGEILPQRIAEIIEIARELDINVVYAEDLIDSRLAETIAGEIPGGRVLVLSPIEGIDQEEQALGIGYIDKMRENIANLKVGLECKQ